MKTINYIFLFVSLSFFAQAQTIRRVTNDPNIPLGTNMYRTLQAAHDAATANDIIYVQSSYQETSYGDATITKKLHIIGNGYSIEENKDLLGANAPYNTGSSVVGSITVNFGTDGIIEGLRINSLTIKARVIVRRCEILGNLDLLKVSATQDASNSSVSHSKIQFFGLNNTSGITTLNNITITNNIIRSAIQGASFSGTVTNIFIRNNYLNAGISNMTNVQLQSNIMHETGSNPNGTAVRSYAYLCPNIVGSNNVCIERPCGIGSNNIDGPLEILLFGYANGGVPTLPRHHILSNDSPAKGAGLGGVDAGPFGTADPFRLSGLPAIPQITSYSSQISNSIYTSSTPMNVTISVKGNN